MTAQRMMKQRTMLWHPLYGCWIELDSPAKWETYGRFVGVWSTVIESN